MGDINPQYGMSCYDAGGEKAIRNPDNDAAASFLNELNDESYSLLAEDHSKYDDDLFDGSYEVL